MAERVGVDRSFLADVERGKRNVSILNLDLIAKGPQGLLVSTVLAAVSATLGMGPARNLKAPFPII